MAGQSTFKASGFAWRLYCGAGVVDSNLRAAVERAEALRAFLICSPSISGKTNLPDRIEAALGKACVGLFDEIENDSTFSSVQAATEAAQNAEADLIIAAGGGSVLVAARAVAIFLAESRSPFKIMTQYEVGQRPISPRLLAPKLPIINIPTTPTSAVNRAGTGLKNPDLDHRMEYFDPKTRPNAIFIDDEALMQTLASVVRSTATTVFSGLVASRAKSGSNPLSQGDMDTAFRVGAQAYHEFCRDPENVEPRRNLCLAAFLQNRAEDDGGRGLGFGPFAADYALATALHLYDPSISQGQATSALHASSIRLASGVDLEAARLVAQSLGVWREGMDASAATSAVARELEAIYRAAKMPVRVRDLKIPKEAFGEIAAETVKNFNANRDAASPETQIARSKHLLEMAW